jgi:hypothetical protein
MTSRRRGRTSPKEARHVRLYHSLLKTQAWKSLDAVERALYVEISSRYGGPASNNGRISYSIREGAKALRIGKTKVATALVNLQERGFIRPVTKGWFDRKDRHATEWLLTEFASDVSSDLATHDYRNWQPSPKIQNAVALGGLTVPAGGLIGTHRRTVAA